jgi:hypothetical protein
MQGLGVPVVAVGSAPTLVIGAVSTNKKKPINEIRTTLLIFPPL